MGVGEAQGLAEADGEPLPRAEALVQRLLECVGEPERVSDGEREIEGHADAVLEALALRHSVGVCEAQRETDGEAVPERLVRGEALPLRERVPLVEKEGAGEGEAEWGALCEARALRETDGEPEPKGEAERE